MVLFFHFAGHAFTSVRWKNCIGLGNNKDELVRAELLNKEQKIHKIGKEEGLECLKRITVRSQII